MVIAAPEVINCVNTSVTLTGTSSVSGLIYLWTTSDGAISSGINTASAVVTTAGTYTLTVTDQSTGCSTSQSIVVTEDTNIPQAVIDPAQDLTCLQTTVELSTSVTGENLTYAWTTVDGQIDNGANTATATVSAGGTYTLTITDPTNGCSSVDNITIQDLSQDITLNLIPSSENISCDVSSVTITANASDPSNLSYVWTTTDGTFTSVTNTSEVTVSTAGTYILNVVNSVTGCTAVRSITIGNITNTPDINIQAPNQITCNNPTVTLIGSSTTSGVTYQWTTLDGIIDSGADQANAIVSAVGNLYADSY